MAKNVFYKRLFSLTILTTILLLSSGCGVAEDTSSEYKIKGKFLFYALRELKEPWGTYIYENGKVRKINRAISPLWSNDGKKIACVKDLTISIYDKNGNLLQSFPETKGAVNIAWSPDNTKFAYTARDISLRSGDHDRIFLYNIETKENKKLVDYNQEYAISQISFSPKGDEILFQKIHPNDIKKGGVYIYDIDTSSLKLIIAQGDRPAWVPDGEYILVLTNRNEDWSMINNKLGVFMKINIETGEKTILRDRNSFIKDVKVSKDGRYFYYSKPVEKGGYIIVVSPIDKPDIEIPITQPVDLGQGQGYSQDFEADWYQGE